MRRVLIALLLSVLHIVPTTAPALANPAGQVRDRDAFLTLVQGKELRIGLYNLTLQVMPDGKIAGSALGWGITGSWTWENGYFCRDMDWSGYAIGYNCQLVEALDAERLRFTSDRGTGQSASFRLR